MKKLILSIAVGLFGMSAHAQITLNGCGNDTLCFGSSKQISFTGSSGGQNKYFYTNTIPSTTTGEPRLEPNLHPNVANISTFSYDFWVKPEKAIALPSVNNSCTNNWALHDNVCNWAIMAQHGNVYPNATYYGVGLSVGTNGICVGEHKANLLTSRITYSATINGWNHVGLTVRTDSMFLYLNGNLVGQRAIDVCPSTPRYMTSAFAQGWLNPAPLNTGGAFKGGLDEIRIWDIALTGSQYNTIMNKKFTSSVSNLIYYISFDNGYTKTSGSEGSTTVNTVGFDNTNIVNGGVSLTNVSGTTINSLTPVTTTYYYNSTAVTSPFYVPINNLVNNIQIYGISGVDTVYSNTLTYYGKDCHIYDTIQVYDTTYTHIIDSIPFYYDVPVMIYDTTYVTIYDTIIVHQNVYDTLFIDFDKWGYNSTTGMTNLGVEVIKVYPIPTMGAMGLKIDIGSIFGSNGQAIFYELRNSNGQLIYGGQISSQITTLNISSFSNGVYTLQIYDNSGQIETKKVVISN
jgi:hypothetical protein